MNTPEMLSRRAIISILILIGLANCGPWLRPSHLNAQASANEAAACGEAGASFRVARQFSVGRSPRALASGDFNNDGLIDLAVLDYGNGTSRNASILLGNGRGEFALFGAVKLEDSLIPLATDNDRLIVSDLNRDSKQDLVIARSNSKLYISIGRGDGSFATPASFSFPTAPGTSPPSSSDVAVADFNGDQNPDIAATFSNGRTLMLVGNGNGSFTQSAPLDILTGSGFSVSADFNSDGKPDLVMLQRSSIIAPFLNRGDGSFTAGATIDVIYTCINLETGDFNSDSKPDLLISTTSSTTIRLGDGRGGFGAAIEAGPSTLSTAIADLNKDGRLDLVGTGYTLNYLALQLGQEGNKFISAGNLGAGSSPTAVMTADFNRDGNLDLAALNRNSDDLSVLLASSPGAFQAALSNILVEEQNSLISTDLNQDGRSDLIATAGTRGTNVLVSNNQGGFGRLTFGPTFGGSDALAVAPADFNNDGKTDLAVASFVSFSSQRGRVSLVLSNQAGNLQTQEPFFEVSSAAAAMAAADFNRDGNADLATANPASNDVSILLGDGKGRFGAATSLPVGLEPRAIVVSELNNDGNPDLVVANRNSATISILLGDGRGGFTQTLVGVEANPRSVTVADLNGDRKPDLVAPNNNTQAVSVLLGIGGGAFGAPILTNVGFNPFAVAVADFSGDGKPDLAVTELISGDRPTTGNNVKILSGDGAGGFTPAQVFAVPTGGYLAAGDFNGDGMTDLAVSSRLTEVWLASTACNPPRTGAPALASAASFNGVALAPDSIAVAFGSGLSAQTANAAALPLPTQLGGSSVKFKDSAGSERLAPLFFVSPGQINFLVPPGSAPGLANVTITGGEIAASSTNVLIFPTRPGLFSANSDGQGIAAGLVLRIKSGGAQSYEPIAQFDPVKRRFIPLPIDLGSSSDQVFLALFGTGIRNRAATAPISASYGFDNAEVLYAGAQGSLVGVDQINLRAPRGLAGRGEVVITLAIGGQAANPVSVSFR